MIKLKVPKEPAAESVSIGYFEADLVPGSTIETESRQFADYLVANFDCTEVVAKKRGGKPADDAANNTAEGDEPPADDSADNGSADGSSEGGEN